MRRCGARSAASHSLVALTLAMVVQSVAGVRSKENGEWSEGEQQQREKRGEAREAASSLPPFALSSHRSLIPHCSSLRLATQRKNESLASCRTDAAQRRSSASAVATSTLRARSRTS